MRTKVKLLTVFVCLAAGVIALAALIYLPYRIAEWMARPPANSTLKGFRDFLPIPTAVVTIEHNRQKYVVVFGKQYFPMERPAGYLFNASGELVGWTTEATASDRLAVFWNSADDEIWRRGSVSYELAVRALEKERDEGRLP